MAAFDAFADCPAPSERRLAVRVTKDALRQIRGGSPWVYDGSIVSTNHDGEPGDLAVIFDDNRKFAAIGLWDPTSPIRIKVLHSGSPAQIDRDWWRRRLHTAADRRSALADDAETTAYRCVHGENDGLPGLVADRYSSTLVVKIYTPAWFAHLNVIVPELVETFNVNRVVLRLGRSVQSGETFGLGDGDVVVGEPVDAPVRFSERGIAMSADVVHGQKTGHFLDQRDNRMLARGMAEGADVLDVFASTGGFSLAAAVGGAKSVHLIDQSDPALATARANFELNRRIPAVSRCAVHTTTGDAFEVLRRLAGRDETFDIVIVDPPSFASNQAAVDRALAAYRRLTMLALPLLRRGGVLVQASCSSRVNADEFVDTVFTGAAAVGAEVREMRRTGHAVDHPIGFEHGAYLKAIFLSIERPARRPDDGDVGSD